MSFFSKIGNMIFGKQGQNPANAAMPYLNQIPGAVGEYYKPFIGRGEQAYGQSQPVYNQMTQNPSDFINQIMRNYTPSEGYKFKEKYMTQGANNTAAQGGFAGTPIAQMGTAQMIQGLLGDEMQQYLQNVLGVQQGGLQGQENRMGQGFQAGLGYGDILGTNLGNQGQLAFQGQSQRNADRSGRRNALLNFLGQGIGSTMGGASTLLNRGG